MENLSVSSLSIVCMAISLILSFVVPVCLLLYLKKKINGSVKSFLVGCATFVIFVGIEGAINFGISHSPLFPSINASNILFSIFGGLMAGIFEETGRLCAFKTVLKKSVDDDNTAIMYGAGHGGIEVIVALGLGMINNIVYAIMINSGNTSVLTESLPPEQVATVQAMFVQLSQTKPAYFLLGIVERFAAVALHMSLSVIVWAACKNKSNMWLFLVAILIHALADAVLAYLARIEVSVIIIEMINYVIAACVILVTVLIWKKIIKAKGENS